MNIEEEFKNSVRNILLTSGIHLCGEGINEVVEALEALDTVKVNPVSKCAAAMLALCTLSEACDIPAEAIKETLRRMLEFRNAESAQIH